MEITVDPKDLAGWDDGKKKPLGDLEGWGDWRKKNPGRLHQL